MSYFNISHYSSASPLLHFLNDRLNKLLDETQDTHYMFFCQHKKLNQIEKCIIILLHKLYLI